MKQNNWQPLVQDLERLNNSLKKVLTGDLKEAKNVVLKNELDVLRQLFVELYNRTRASELEAEERYRKLQLSYISLEEKYAQSYTFRIIQEQISRELDSKELLNKALDVVMGVFGSRKSIIYMMDEAKNALVAKAFVGFKDHDGLQGYKAEISFEEENNFYVRTCQEKRVFTTMVSGNDTVLGERYQIMMLPLNARHSCLGLMVLEVDIDRQMEPELLEFAEAIARELSLSLENAYLYDKMRTMAISDGLTAIYNRMYLMTYMTELFAKAPETVSVIIFDLDHFKQINDRFGHLNGDLVLKTTAKIALEAVNEGILARYGGEEFVIVLPETGPDQAFQIGETVRRLVEGHRYLNENGVRMPVTLSAGVANFPLVALSYEDILQLADQALYQAKENGRNRVCVAQKVEIYAGTK
jgi:diguanylate cyclase (GGDEF)-like protein